MGCPCPGLYFVLCETHTGGRGARQKTSGAAEAGRQAGRAGGQSSSPSSSACISCKPSVWIVWSTRGVHSIWGCAVCGVREWGLFPPEPNHLQNCQGPWRWCIRVHRLGFPSLPSGQAPHSLMEPTVPLQVGRRARTGTAGLAADAHRNCSAGGQSRGHSQPCWPSCARSAVNTGGRGSPASLPCLVLCPC